jgi:hypothetical protein
VYAIGAEPDHVPAAAVSVCPDLAVPVIDGAVVVVGAVAWMIVPLAPVAQHAPGTHATPYSALPVPEVCATHEEPVLVVASSVPLAPTVQHVDAEGQLTALSWLVVPDVCEVQDAPVFAVSRIFPLAPTAKHSAVVAHETPYSAPLVPDDFDVQLDPVLVLKRIVPFAPTA